MFVIKYMHMIRIHPYTRETAIPFLITKAGKQTIEACMLDQKQPLSITSLALSICLLSLYQSSSCFSSQCSFSILNSAHTQLRANATKQHGQPSRLREMRERGQHNDARSRASCLRILVCSRHRLLARGSSVGARRGVETRANGRHGARRAAVLAVHEI